MAADVVTFDGALEEPRGEGPLLVPAKGEACREGTGGGLQGAPHKDPARAEHITAALRNHCPAQCYWS